MIEKVKKMIFCSLCLTVGLLAKPSLADPPVLIDPRLTAIKSEVVKLCSEFKTNDKRVVILDTLVSNDWKQRNPGKKFNWHNRKPFNDAYEILTIEHKIGNCRTIAEHFRRLFDSAGIRNEKMDIIFSPGDEHSVVIYEIGGKWYVLDFMAAYTGFNSAPNHIEFSQEVSQKCREESISALRLKAVMDSLQAPIEEYCFNRAEQWTGKRPLAFGVYEKDSDEALDLGQFMPHLKQRLDSENFMFLFTFDDMKDGLLRASYGIIKRTGDELDPTESNKALNPGVSTMTLNVAIFSYGGLAKMNPTRFSKMYSEHTFPEAVYHTLEYINAKGKQSEGNQQ